MTKEEIIKKYEMMVEGGELVAPFMGEDVKEAYEMLKAGLSALRPITREQVEKAWRGEWKGVPKLGVYDMACSKCGYSPGIRFYSSEFCPNCGAPMTDEAVQMVMERWKEALE